MATTSTIPTKSMPAPGGMPMTYGPWGGFNPTVPFGFNPSPMTTPLGASFYPPTMSKFPPGIAGSTGVPPMTGSAMMPTVPPPGYTPGFGPEAWGSFEPEPWTSFPPYSYRGWPLDVTNTFGPSNSWPMTTPFGPTSSWPMTNATGSTWPTNPTSLLTLSNVNFRPNNWVEFYSMTNPVRILDRDGNRMLFLSFDMRGFKPEEVSVSLNKADRSIVIEANYEYKDPKEHQLTRKFYRKFVLPDTLKNVDLSKVDLHASLNVNGTLIVEAMLPRMSYEELGKWTSGTHMHGMPTGGPMPGVPGFGVTPGISFPVTCRPVNA